MASYYKMQYILLWTFVKNPIKDLPSVSTIKEKIKVFIPLIILEFLLAIFSGALIAGFGNSEIASGNKLEIQRFTNHAPPWVIFIIIVIITPLIEELFFRLSLRLNEKFLHFNITILFTGITLFFLSSVKVNWIRISFLIFGVILLLVYYIKKEKVNKFILIFWDRNFFYVFYFFVFSYGLLHITNFNPRSIMTLLIPIIILPQLILGLFCGYVRLKLGFSWGCLFHFFHNGIVMIPILIFSLDQLSLTN